VRLLLHDYSGRERVINAKVVNVSVAGVKIVVDEVIPIHSLVFCNDVTLGIQGAASVRYCVFAKGKYEVGLEFTGGSGWRETQKDS